MTDKRIDQIAISAVAILFVIATALGAVFRSIPWIVVGAWLGFALAAELTGRNKP